MNGTWRRRREWLAALMNDLMANRRDLVFRVEHSRVTTSDYRPYHADWRQEQRKGTATPTTISIQRFTKAAMKLDPAAFDESRCPPRFYDETSEQARSRRQKDANRKVSLVLDALGIEVE